MSASRVQVLSLYKKMLRESKKFTDYNFRTYFLRKIRDEFHSNKDVSDPSKVKQLVQEAEENLKMMQRQVLVGQMYGEGKLVIESEKNIPS